MTLFLLGGALSFVYMFQIYQHDHWRPEAAAGTPTPLVPRVLTLLLAGVVVASGLWPEPLLAFSGAAADILAGGGGP